MYNGCGNAYCIDADEGDNYQNEFTHTIHYNELATKVQKKMHKYKKNEQKFIFRLVFSVFGLRGLAVASVFPRISLICTDLLCYPCSSVRSVEITRKMHVLLRICKFFRTFAAQNCKLSTVNYQLI